MSRKKVYRVHLVRTVESWIDVIAESESDAEDMCLIGIGVKEYGELDARSDMENLVVGHGVTRYNDEIDGACFTEDVTDEHDLEADEEDELPEEDTNEYEIDDTDENEESE